MTGFNSKRSMASDRWINNDIHHYKSKPEEPKLKSAIKKRKVNPYPTKERLHELFTLNGNMLVRKKPHHKERADRIAGCKIKGFWYVMVDGRQCKVERLVKIYNEDE